MRKLRIVLSIWCLVGITATNAQEYNFGIRAGLNFSKFDGPTTKTEAVIEQFGYSNGFHFGITFDYNITDLFSLRTEFLYIQNGSEYTYEGDSYYRVFVDANNTVTERGSSVLRLDRSNAYLSVPLLASYKISPKFTIMGGVYGGMLIQPTGGGTLEFNSFDRPNEISFTQTLDYRYNSDLVMEGTSPIRPIGVIVDGQKVNFPKSAGAYFQYFENEKNGNLINRWDAGVTGAVHYFLNKGFYIGLRADFGLMDITNDQVDRSLLDVNEDGSLIFDSHKDTHFGIHTSFGFKF